MFRKLRVVLLTLLSALMLFASIGVLAACGGEDQNSPPSAVNPATIKYDGNYLTWSKPAGYVTSYDVTINDVSSPHFHNGQEKQTKSWSYKSHRADEYQVVIVAKNEAGSSAPAGKSFIPLAEIPKTSLSFDSDGKMTWEAVPNAVDYMVEINNQEYSTQGLTEYTDFQYGKENAIRVKAVGPNDSFFSFYPTEKVNKTYLGTPTSVTYDGADIRWNAQATDASTSYTVYINGSEYQRGIKQSRFEYNSNNTNFSVQVQAVGDGSSSFSSPISEEKNFRFLGAVQNIHIDDDGILRWDEVKDATDYVVKMTKAGNAVTTETLDVTYFEDVPENIEFNIEIKPTAPVDNQTFYFTTWSKAEKFHLLAKPELHWNENLDHTDGAKKNGLYWDEPGVGASAVNLYRIKLDSTIDGQKQATQYFTSPTGMPVFNFDYPDVGTYWVSVQTVASTESGFNNSKYTAPVEVRRLAAPTPGTSKFIESTKNDVTKGIDVYFNNAHSADSYVLWVDGAKDASMTSTGDMIEIGQIVENTTTETMVVNYQLQSVGSTDMSRKLVELPSIINETQKSMPFQVTVLATPTNIQIDGGIMTWNVVSEAKGTYLSGLDSSLAVSTFDLTGLDPGRFSLTLCAIGNGKEILASPRSEVTVVHKLDAPTNIRVFTEVDEGQITYDPEPLGKATSYAVYLNGLPDPRESTEWGNINKHMTPQGVSVQVVSVANYLDSTDQVYYISSFKSATEVFLKLEDPVFRSPSAFANGYLNWAAPGNVVTSTLPVVYRVTVESLLLSGKQTTYSDVQEGTQFSVTELEAGEHTFIIKCLGNGKSVASEEVTMTVTKLKTPEVKIDQNTMTQYTWKRVSQAEKYQVYIDGILMKAIEQEEATATGDIFYTPENIIQLKDYDIKIIAVGNGGIAQGATGGTIDSNPCQFTQKVKKLLNPTFTYKYVNPEYNPDTATESDFDTNRFHANGQIVVNINAAIANANGYRYNIGGTKQDVLLAQTDTPLEHKRTANQKQKYEIVVTAMGGRFDADDYYYINSDDVGGANTSITLLSNPNASNIELDGNTLSFPTLASERGMNYRCVVYFEGYEQDASKKEVINNTVAKFYVSDTHIGKRIVKVAVQIIGNGTTTISSEIVEKIPTSNWFVS